MTHIVGLALWAFAATSFPLPISQEDAISVSRSFRALAATGFGGLYQALPPSPSVTSLRSRTIEAPDDNWQLDFQDGIALVE